MITLVDGRMFDYDTFEKAMDELGLPLKNIDVRQKNGNDMTCISIDTSTNVCPSFYLENYPDSVLNDPEGLAQKVKHMIEDSDFDEKTVPDFTTMAKEDFLKGLNIVVQRHRDDQSILKKKYCDLDAVVKYTLAPGMTITLTHQITDAISGLTEDEVWESAETNTFTDTSLYIKTLVEIFEEMLREKGESEETIQRLLHDPAMIHSSNVNMYVATNKDRLLGFTQVFNYKAMQKWMKEHSFDNAYIIPSSVHEGIIMPITDDMDEFSIDNLKAMICNVNQTQVPPQDVLSDHLYMINVNTGIINIL